MGSGRKPRRQVFSQRGSFDDAIINISKVSCTCTAWFVWGLVGNPEDRFSHNEAHMIMQSLMFGKVSCTCTAQFVWGLVGDPEGRFSHNEAHLMMQSLILVK